MTEQDKQALIKHFCSRDCGEAAKDCTIMPCHEIELIQEFQTTEPDSDTISRRAAITQLSHNKRKGDEEWELAVANDIRTIWKLPPAQPEPHWILCSERMPEEHEWIGTKRFGTTISDEVYVTFENPKGERFCKHLSFQNGELSAFDKSTIDAFYKGSKPIAWMPLPEPYKEVTT